MKTKTLLVLLMLISVSCFGRPQYTIPKQDFIDQFSGPKPPRRIYCINDKGNKVWVICNMDTRLTLVFQNNKSKGVVLNTVKYKSGIIVAREFPKEIPGSKIDSFNIEGVQSITMGRGPMGAGMYVMPYFNLDSTRKVAQAMNDSMEAEYAARNEPAIYLDPKRNSLLLIAGACYSMDFKDGNGVKYGVIRQITRDSIYITSSFNEAMAADNKKEYITYQYAIGDISRVSLLKSGGFGSKNIKIEDYNVVDKLDKTTRRRPYFYVADPTDGEIRLYRSLLTERGFFAITEQDGMPVWYEGE